MKTAPLVVLAISLTTPALAEPAPSQLRGKSTRIAWSESKVQRALDSTEFRNEQRQYEMRLYFGESGRMFSRLNNRGRTTSWNEDQVTGQAEARMVPNFHGRTLTLYRPVSGGGGMRLIKVQFDDGFAGCNASVSLPRQADSTMMITRSGQTGQQYEVKSASASGPTCSVQVGNIFN